MMSNVWRLLLYRIWCTADGKYSSSYCFQTWLRWRKKARAWMPKAVEGLITVFRPLRRHGTDMNTYKKRKKGDTLCSTRVEVIRTDRREFQGFRKQAMIIN